jgi:hypothetical protein
VMLELEEVLACMRPRFREDRWARSAWMEGALSSPFAGGLSCRSYVIVRLQKIYLF